MSASQTPSPGATPNGAVPTFFRRRKPADPLIRKKPLLKKPPQQTSAPNLVNGAAGPGTTPARRPSPLPGRPTSQNLNNGQPAQLEGPYKDYPVFTTKRALREGLRYHAMRFLPGSTSLDKAIDPSNESQFTRPVRLHRRDPRINPLGNWKEAGSEADEVDEKAAVMDDKERARIEAQKAERRAEREATQAQIAPVIKTSSKQRNKFQKKTEQVYQASDASGKKRDLQLRYEEALPWHIEDFDNKNTWAGTYEAALSDCHLLFFPNNAGQDGGSYSMVPVEKWYKFTAKNQFKVLSIEEAEARMAKKMKDPRWFMDTQKENERKRRDEYERQSGSQLFARKGERGERPGQQRWDEERTEEAADVDDIDFNYEEDFADDEENVLFGGNDEENKEAQDKITREQREANIFELKEQKDYDKEEEEEKQKARDEKKLSKKTQKALMKREKNFVYEDDSEENPYSEESETEDSEVERQRAEELKQKEQQKDDGKIPSNEKIPSGASSKGTNTPSGRPSKHPESRKNLLKRPGSPNLSEASGNESSSRKKLKKSRPLTSQPGEAAAAGLTISRPTSPSNDPLRKSSIKLNLDPNNSGNMSPKSGGKRPGAGSGSDGEGSDGASRVSKKQKALGSGSRPTSPGGSRAGSPAASAPAAASANRRPLPTAEEIRAVVPPEGIGLHKFLELFKGRTSHPQFMTLVRANSKWVKEDKILLPKGAAGPAGAGDSGKTGEGNAPSA